MIFAVLAEDRTDADVLVVLIKRIRDKANMTVYKKGFSGCGELCRKAWSHIENFADQGATHFIICHDSDGDEPETIRQKVREHIKKKLNGGPFPHRIIVPVQELESWIIADEEAIRLTIPTLVIKPQLHPETIKSPKEWLKDESRNGGSKPLYAPATFNAKVAVHLNIDKVKNKCKSFKELVNFVKDGNQIS